MLDNLGMTKVIFMSHYPHKVPIPMCGTMNMPRYNFSDNHRSLAHHEIVILKYENIFLCINPTLKRCEQPIRAFASNVNQSGPSEIDIIYLILSAIIALFCGKYCVIIPR